MWIATRKIRKWHTVSTATYEGFGSGRATILATIQILMISTAGARGSGLATAAQRSHSASTTLGVWRHAAIQYFTIVAVQARWQMGPLTYVYVRDL